MLLIYRSFHRTIFNLLLFVTVATTICVADTGSLITREEFSRYAAEFAPKVNLFKDAWDQDARAEFFGGSSRDFLYFLKSKLLKDARTREDVERNAKALRLLPSIDVRDFIIGDSDVDVISSWGLRLDAGKYGVRKIDHIDSARLNPASSAGQTERNQGYIPVEKIRLSKNGIIDWKEFGDGAGEILSGRLTLTVPTKEEFEKTYYAQQGKNHRILLALRYVRLVATHIYATRGRNAPISEHDVVTIIPVEAREEIRKLVQEAKSDPNLAKLLRNDWFRNKLNDTVHKAFRSYVNPTAAFHLYKYFGIDDLVASHSSIDPINQYLFSKYRDPAVIADHFRGFGFKPEDVLQKPKTYFPDGKLYHGTRTEEAFRNILLVGVLASESGNAGKGLYGVSNRNMNFSINWGGSKERLLMFDVNPTARIVDITTGKGSELWSAYCRRFGHDYEGFAEYFDFDIIRYPYSPEAFIVKNSSALGRPNGYTRQILTVGEFLARASEVREKSEFIHFTKQFEINQLTDHERFVIIKATPYFETLKQNVKDTASAADFIDVLKQMASLKPNEIASVFSDVPKYRETRINLFAEKIHDEKLLREFVGAMKQAGYNVHQIADTIDVTPYYKNILGHLDTEKKVRAYEQMLFAFEVHTVSPKESIGKAHEIEYSVKFGNLFSRYSEKNPLSDAERKSLLTAIEVHKHDDRWWNQLCPLANVFLQRDPFDPKDWAIVDALIEVAVQKRHVRNPNHSYDTHAGLLERLVHKRLLTNPQTLEKLIVAAGTIYDVSTLKKIADELLVSADPKEHRAHMEQLIKSYTQLKAAYSNHEPTQRVGKAIWENILHQIPWNEEYQLRAAFAAALERTGDLILIRSMAKQVAAEKTHDREVLMHHLLNATGTLGDTTRESATRVFARASDFLSHPTLSSNVVAAARGAKDVDFLRELTSKLPTLSVGDPIHREFMSKLIGTTSVVRDRSEYGRVKNGFFEDGYVRSENVGLLPLIADQLSGNISWLKDRSFMDAFFAEADKVRDQMAYHNLAKSLSETNTKEKRYVPELLELRERLIQKAIINKDKGIDAIIDRYNNQKYYPGILWFLVDPLLATNIEHLKRTIEVADQLKDVKTIERIAEIVFAQNEAKDLEEIRSRLIAVAKRLRSPVTAKHLASHLNNQNVLADKPRVMRELAQLAHLVKDTETQTLLAKNGFRNETEDHRDPLSELVHSSLKLKNLPGLRELAKTFALSAQANRRETLVQLIKGVGSIPDSEAEKVHALILNHTLAADAWKNDTELFELAVRAAAQVNDRETLRNFAKKMNPAANDTHHHRIRSALVGSSAITKEITESGAPTVIEILASQESAGRTALVAEMITSATSRKDKLALHAIVEKLLPHANPKNFSSHFESLITSSYLTSDSSNYPHKKYKFSADRYVEFSGYSGTLSKLGRLLVEQPTWRNETALMLKFIKKAHQFGDLVALRDFVEKLAALPSTPEFISVKLAVIEAALLNKERPTKIWGHNDRYEWYPTSLAQLANPVLISEHEVLTKLIDAARTRNDVVALEQIAKQVFSDPKMDKELSLRTRFVEAIVAVKAPNALQTLSKHLASRNIIRGELAGAHELVTAARTLRDSATIETLSEHAFSNGDANFEDPLKKTIDEAVRAKNISAIRKLALSIQDPARPRNKVLLLYFIQEAGKIPDVSKDGTNNVGALFTLFKQIATDKTFEKDPDVWKEIIRQATNQGDRYLLRRMVEVSAVQERTPFHDEILNQLADSGLKLKDISGGGGASETILEKLSEKSVSRSLALLEKVLRHAIVVGDKRLAKKLIDNEVVTKSPIEVAAILKAVIESSAVAKDMSVETHYRYSLSKDRYVTPDAYESLLFHLINKASGNVNWNQNLAWIEPLMSALAARKDFPALNRLATFLSTCADSPEVRTLRRKMVQKTLESRNKPRFVNDSDVKKVPVPSSLENLISEKLVSDPELLKEIIKAARTHKDGGALVQMAKAIFSVKESDTHPELRTELLAAANAVKGAAKEVPQLLARHLSARDQLQEAVDFVQQLNQAARRFKDTNTPYWLAQHDYRRPESSSDSVFHEVIDTIVAQKNDTAFKAAAENFEKREMGTKRNELMYLISQIPKMDKHKGFIAASTLLRSVVTKQPWNTDTELIEHLLRHTTHVNHLPFVTEYATKVINMSDSPHSSRLISALIDTLASNWPTKGFTIEGTDATKDTALPGVLVHSRLIREPELIAKLIATARRTGNSTVLNRIVASVNNDFSADHLAIVNSVIEAAKDVKDVSVYQELKYNSFFETRKEISEHVGLLEKTADLIDLPQWRTNKSFLENLIAATSKTADRRALRIIARKLASYPADADATKDARIQLIRAAHELREGPSRILASKSYYNDTHSDIASAFSESVSKDVIETPELFQVLVQSAVDLKDRTALQKIFEHLRKELIESFQKTGHPRYLEQLTYLLMKASQKGGKINDSLVTETLSMLPQGDGKFQVIKQIFAQKRYADRFHTMESLLGAGADAFSDLKPTGIMASLSAVCSFAYRRF